MAPRRSTPISPSRRWSRSARENGLPLDGLRGAEELHQGGRQGHAEGDVQDGHLDLPVLLRRADLRRGRPVVARFVEKYFTGTATTIEGVGLPEIAEEAVRRHRDAYGDNPIYARHARRRRRLRLPPARRGPCLDAGDRSRRLQHAVRGNLPDEYKAFARDDQRAERAAADHPRPDAAEARPTQPIAARGGRAGRATSSSASPPAR